MERYKYLLEAARTAAEAAYCPYSKFRVGAAVLLDNDVVITGSNQENASYSLTICAERVALNYAKSQYPTANVLAIAIASPSTEKLVSPCGACRTVMTEVAMRQGIDFTVVMSGSEIVTKTTSELMPLAFELER